MKLEELLFQTIGSHLLQDVKPSLFLQEFLSNPEHHIYPFTLLLPLKTTEQSPLHHPEGNVWNHTLLVVDQAAKVKEKSKNPPTFMWAALLHDIGKPITTKKRKSKITSYDHDWKGAQLAKEFLEELTSDTEFISQVTILVKYHMHILYVVKNLPFGDFTGLVTEGDPKEIALLGWCDRTGRGKVKWDEERKNIDEFLKLCKRRTS